MDLKSANDNNSCVILFIELSDSEKLGDYVDASQTHIPETPRLPSNTILCPGDLQDT